jgi:hypothetical protein
MPLKSQSVIAVQTDRGDDDRCITRNPMMFFTGVYNAAFQIVQTPSHIIIAAEMMHDTPRWAVSASGPIADAASYPWGVNASGSVAQ